MVTDRPLCFTPVIYLFIINFFRALIFEAEECRPVVSLPGCCSVIYKNTITSNTTNIFTFDISVSIRDLHQKKFVQFFFQFLPWMMIVMRRGKKLVVCVAQRVVDLVPVQGLSSFLNMYKHLIRSSWFLVDALGLLSSRLQSRTVEWPAW